jgi:hypothetical protein
MKICLIRYDALWFFRNFPAFLSNVTPASVMQNEAEGSSWMSVYVYRATWCHIPKEGKLRIYHIRIWRLRFRMCFILAHVSFPFLFYSSFLVKVEILLPSFFLWLYCTPGLHEFRPSRSPEPPNLVRCRLLFVGPQHGTWFISSLRGSEIPGCF